MRLTLQSLGCSPTALPDHEKREDCVEAAKEGFQTFANLLNMVRFVFRLFLVDSSRRQWSSWNAKDIICGSFVIVGGPELDWPSVSF